MEIETSDLFANGVYSVEPSPRFADDEDHLGGSLKGSVIGKNY